MRVQRPVLKLLWPLETPSGELEDWIFSMNNIQINIFKIFPDWFHVHFRPCMSPEQTEKLDAFDTMDYIC